KEVDFDAIYTSPSGRTISTTNLIKGEREIPVFLNDNLREINLGDWEGQTLSDIENKYPNEYYAYWNTPHVYKPINGESFEDLKKRVLEAIHSIQKKHSTGNVLIVTHSVAIKILLASFKNEPIEKLWGPPFIHDTSLTIVELNGNERNIVLEGDISHREMVMQRSEERRVGKECRTRWSQYQAEDGIRDFHVTGVQTCALPICSHRYAFSCD